jgi:hypothetical protein
MEARDEGVSAARLERLVGEEGATIVGEETRGEERIFRSGKHRFFLQGEKHRFDVVDHRDDSRETTAQKYRRSKEKPGT